MARKQKRNRKFSDNETEKPKPKPKKRKFVPQENKITKYFVPSIRENKAKRKKRKFSPQKNKITKYFVPITEHNFQLNEEIGSSQNISGKYWLTHYPLPFLSILLKRKFMPFLSTMFANFLFIN